MQKRTAHLLRYIPFLVWGAAIGVLSLMAAPPTPELPLMSWDKFQHAGAYALFTFFAGYAFLPHLRYPVAWSVAFALALFYGGALEIAQGALTAVRAPEWYDLAADLVGAAFVLIAAFFHRRAAPVRRR